MNSKPWHVQNRFFHLENKWLTLRGEHLQDTEGHVLEYWRVEKADSIIIIPIQNQQLILPPPAYRPGIDQVTLDFPGGRWKAGLSLEETAMAILQRELMIFEEMVLDLTVLNAEGWLINSSFSNQKLYGLVAHLEGSIHLPTQKIGSVYSTTQSGIKTLLNQLSCLQCRAVLLEWWVNQ